MQLTRTREASIVFGVSSPAQARASTTMENPMLRTASILCATAAFGLSACGDDPVKPGALNVKWDHGPTSATCGSRGVSSIEVRALKNDVEVASASGDCPADAENGTVQIPKIDPGSYKIEVEAFTTTTPKKGIFYAEIAKQNIGEGKTVDVDVELTPKKATITVDWALPGAGRCSTAGIDQIEVALYYDASDEANLVGTPQKVDCESTGIVFADLSPNDDVQLIAYGYAANKKVAKATTPFFAITPGDEIEEVMALETCPGTPPACSN